DHDRVERVVVIESEDRGPGKAAQPLRPLDAYQSAAGQHQRAQQAAAILWAQAGERRRQDVPPADQGNRGRCRCGSHGCSMPGSLGRAMAPGLREGDRMEPGAVAGTLTAAPRHRSSFNSSFEAAVAEDLENLV